MFEPQSDPDSEEEPCEPCVVLHILLRLSLLTVVDTVLVARLEIQRLW